MDSEVRPYDDEAGFGPWTGEVPESRESVLSRRSERLPDNGSPGEDPGPARRRFLALAGAAAGAVPLAGMLRHGHRRAASPQAGPGIGDWMALRSALSTHKLIRPGEQDLPDREGTLRPEVRLQAAGWHRVLCQPP